MYNIQNLGTQNIKIVTSALDSGKNSKLFRNNNKLNYDTENNLSH